MYYINLMRNASKFKPGDMFINERSNHIFILVQRHLVPLQTKNFKKQGSNIAYWDVMFLHNENVRQIKEKNLRHKVKGGFLKKANA